MPENEQIVETEAALLARLPGAGAVDNELVSAAVAEINAAWHAGYLTSASQVGELVLNRFFGGDPANARSRRRKHASFKELAKHPDLQLGATTLWYCVQVYEQIPQLGEELAERLSLAHHRLLTHIQDMEQRRVLALRAADEGLTVRQLNDEIALARGGAPRAGRPPELPATKTINRVKNAIAALNEVNQSTLGALDAPKRELALTDARQFVEQVTAWWAAIEAAEAARLAAGQ